MTTSSAGMPSRKDSEESQRDCGLSDLGSDFPICLVGPAGHSHRVLATILAGRPMLCPITTKPALSNLGVFCLGVSIPAGGA